MNEDNREKLDDLFRDKLHSYSKVEKDSIDKIWANIEKKRGGFYKIKYFFKRHWKLFLTTSVAVLLLGSAAYYSADENQKENVTPKAGAIEGNKLNETSIHKLKSKTVIETSKREVEKVALTRIVATIKEAPFNTNGESTTFYQSSKLTRQELVSNENTNGTSGGAVQKNEKYLPSKADKDRKSRKALAMDTGSVQAKDKTGDVMHTMSEELGVSNTAKQTNSLPVNNVAGITQGTVNKTENAATNQDNSPEIVIEFDKNGIVAEKENRKLNEILPTINKSKVGNGESETEKKILIAENSINQNAEAAAEHIGDEGINNMSMVELSESVAVDAGGMDTLDVSVSGQDSILNALVSDSSMALNSSCPRKYTFEIGFAPLYFSANSLLNNADFDYAQRRSVYKFSYNYDFHIGYNLNENLKVLTGISLTKLNLQNTFYLTTLITNSVIENKTMHLMDPVTGLNTWTFIDTVVTTEIKTDSIVSDASYTYLSIPVRFNISKNFGKISLGADFGATYNFMMKKTSVYKWQNGQSETIKTGFTKGIGLGVLAGLNVSYAISNQLGIAIAPTVNYYLRSNLRRSHWLAKAPITFLVNARIQYKFGPCIKKK